MEQHHKKEVENYDYLYYLVALLTGLFIGAIIDVGFMWIPIGGILGLLSAALFLKVLVKGREDA